MESSEPARRTALSVPAVRRLVAQWRAALARRPSAADLLPHLANGLLLELPGRTVRGTDEFQGHFEEFRTWYRQRAGGFGFLGGPPAEEVRIQLVSPIHAQVTITRAGAATATAAGAGAAASRAGSTGPATTSQHDTDRQIWWVVLQGGVPRIRGIAFVQHPPVGALTRR
ncbi:hypothetical protein [Streptomyces sp. 8L]|uniref:hypothetical protein n=1 Tax=Streptomyces sp. 8L TaxID=2877242 RepID=UPI001CD2B614|nr:hypothetical protein [Streptomyces sp. 8L]MCA1216881.1 hypothetical protein [Streptomyces sp. 8L]